MLLLIFNRINNRLVIKIKDGYKLELQTPEAMKLFDSTKKNRQNEKRRKCTKSLSVSSSFSIIQFSKK